MDLATLIEKAIDEEKFVELFSDNLTQFIDFQNRQPYLGSLLLPDMLKTENKYDEQDFQFKSIVADDTGRYDPAVKKKRAARRSLSVSFGHYNIGTDIVANEIDHINELLNMGSDEQAMTYLTNLVRLLGRKAVQDKREIHKMEAIVEARTTLVGANGREFVLNQSDPAGHRFAANGNWSDDTYNPITGDVLPAIDILEDLGMQVRGMYCRRKASRLLQGNEQVRTNVFGNINFVPPTQVSLDAISAYLSNQRDNVTDLPPIRTYNKTYDTQTETRHFLPDDVFVIVARTPRDYSIAIEDGEDLLIQSTLGYYGIGKPQARTQPGDVIQVRLHNELPMYIELVAFGCGAPVIQEPTALVVINGIA